MSRALLRHICPAIRWRLPPTERCQLSLRGLSNFHLCCSNQQHATSIACVFWLCVSHKTALVSAQPGHPRSPVSQEPDTSGSSRPDAPTYFLCMNADSLPRTVPTDCFLQRPNNLPSGGWGPPPPPSQAPVPFVSKAMQAFHPSSQGWNLRFSVSLNVFEFRAQMT